MTAGSLEKFLCSVTGWQLHCRGCGAGRAPSSLQSQGLGAGGGVVWGTVGVMRPQPPPPH